MELHWKRSQCFYEDWKYFFTLVVTPTDKPGCTHQIENRFHNHLGHILSAKGVWSVVHSYDLWSSESQCCMFCPNYYWYYSQFQGHSFRHPQVSNRISASTNCRLTPIYRDIVWYVPHSLIEHLIFVIAVLLALAKICVWYKDLPLTKFLYKKWQLQL